MEKVCVLMSTYNGEKFIEEQLDSVLAQKDCVVRLLVRDDGSSDGTTQILDKYKSEGKLDWYTGKNLKPSLSFLDLLYQAQDCDYYAFCDQDDIWDNDKLVSAVEKLRIYGDKPAFYHSNAKLADSQGKDSGRPLHNSDPKLNLFSVGLSGGILGCTMVFNRALRELIVSAKAPEKTIMHDFYVGLVCLACGGTGVYDNTAHIRYRQHGGNVLGVAIDIKSKIKSKLNQFLKKEQFTICEQAEDVLERYSDKMTNDGIKVCKRIAHHRDNIFRTIATAFSPKAHFSSFKNSMFIRACLLFRR